MHRNFHGGVNEPFQVGEYTGITGGQVGHCAPHICNIDVQLPLHSSDGRGDILLSGWRWQQRKMSVVNHLRKEMFAPVVIGPHRGGDESVERVVRLGIVVLLRATVRAQAASTDIGG